MPTPPASLSDDQKFHAGVVYNETSGLRAIGEESQKQLQLARDMMACVSIRRSGKGLAPSKIPSDGEQKYPPAHAAWEAASSAALSAGETCKTTAVKHFVIWPSDDGKTPTKTPAMPASWPYTEVAKITSVFGPFSKPAKGGDVPISDKVYIYFYTGVK